MFGSSMRIERSCPADVEAWSVHIEEEGPNPIRCSSLQGRTRDRMEMGWGIWSRKARRHFHIPVPKRLRNKAELNHRKMAKASKRRNRRRK